MTTTPKTFFATVFLALLIGGLGAGSASAQSPTPITTAKNGNSTVRLQLNYDGGFYVPGSSLPTSPADSIPATGAGTRLMWYPAKAAFRAGQAGFRQGKSDVWDALNVGFASVALGADTKASGDAATAMGDQTIASGNAATASGDSTVASAFAATALGFRTIATSPRATAMGVKTTASADEATAMGVRTNASDDRATAMGFETTADGDDATAMGRNTVANARQSTAIGDNTTASGAQSTAMGFNTEASGLQATAIGTYTNATGNRATTIGLGTTAANSRSLAIGECNSANTAASDNTLFVVGSGGFDLGSESCSSRDDAFTVDTGGSATAASHDTFSDRRLKTAIEPLGEGTLQKLADLRPVRYEFEDQRTHPSGEQVGLIAQDVRKEFPALVSEGTDGMLSLAYPKLTAVLLKGLQEQQAELEERQSQIRSLQTENERIKKRLAVLEAKISRPAAHPAGLAGPWGIGLLIALGLGGLGGALLTRRRS